MDGGLVLVKTGAVLDQARRLPRLLGRSLLDTLYPPLCLNCETAVAEADTLCANCFRQLRAITPPMCPRLGLPFPVSLGPDALSEKRYWSLLSCFHSNGRKSRELAATTIRAMLNRVANQVCFFFKKFVLSSSLCFSSY